MMVKKRKAELSLLRTWHVSADEDIFMSGPDAYEDSMLSAKTPDSPQTWHEDGSPTAGKGSNFFGEDDSSGLAQADRISLVLGTANRIAPLQEDFSLGSAVFV